MSVYFTSKVYARMFLEEKQLLLFKSIDPSVPADDKLGDWDLLHFFYFIVAVEHGLLFLKILIGAIIDDVPPEVQQGEREVGCFIENFQNLRDD